VNQSSKRLEIIWLSRDRSIEDFNSVRKNCPWLAVPFDQDKIESILQRFDIDVIPKLYLLNSDGSLAHTECRQDIVTKGPAAVNDWVRIRN
jgi:nucleoredoxin